MSRTSPTARALSALSLAALALAGCSSDDAPNPTPTQPSGTSASTPASSTPTPTPTDTASASGSPSPSGTPTTAPAGFSLKTVSTPGYPKMGGDLGTIGAVRVGRHPGYDRVVWQFPGSGRPSLQVRYVDQPIGDGSGDVVKVRGAAYIEVLVSSVGIPPENTPIPGSAPAASLAGTVVADALPVYGGFEGIGQTFVGVRDSKRPFRVTVLTNPTRLVVDIWSG